METTDEKTAPTIAELDALRREVERDALLMLRDRLDGMPPGPLVETLKMLMSVTRAPEADIATLRHQVEVAALTTLAGVLAHANTQHASEALAALAQLPR